MLKTRLGIGYGWAPEQTALATAALGKTNGAAFGATATARQARVASPAMDEAARATRGL